MFQGCFTTDREKDVICSLSHCPNFYFILLVISGYSEDTASTAFLIVRQNFTSKMSWPLTVSMIAVISLLTLSISKPQLFLWSPPGGEPSVSSWRPVPEFWSYTDEKLFHSFMNKFGFNLRRLWFIYLTPFCYLVYSFYVQHHIPTLPFIFTLLWGVMSLYQPWLLVLAASSVCSISLHVK